ncbi:diguanylate cyclase domain-containing protein [Thiocystis violacea]|uniref:diguanylate cyclase domain-containing protein n=1 Tax=Thiocystis violacea TaxID=13725 RepID=UPI00190408F9|nr:diguanylate cyclase [Thiocystis violacea]MBK1721263.1 diguanylate cyclase response regulator [Thiocystis violacea]
MTQFFTKRPTVLIVDDVTANIEVLIGALESDYEIQFATSGEETLELLAAEEKPDLVLLDVMMPGMDGYEVCRRLKVSPATQDIPIIFVTAKNEIEDETLGFDLGAVDYVTKPFSLPSVRARVRTHVRLKRQADLLESLISLDGLTNIPNRRRFDAALHVEWGRAVKDREPLSLLMIDVDHFKGYNDHYGHGPGDICLCALATCLTETLSRPGDLAARYGGEEFAVLLPQCDEQEARRIAEALRAAVEAKAIPHAQSATSPWVTVTIGAAWRVPAAGDRPRELLRLADQALYAAKGEGRNRVGVFSARAARP